MNTRTYLNKQVDRVRKGAIVPLVGFMLVVLIGMVAFVGDIGNVIVVKSTLAASADAAALAGAGAMAESYGWDDIKLEAVKYGLYNVPGSYGQVLDESSVTFGNWNAASQTFTSNNIDPTAVRVVVGRTHARENAVPYFFAKVLGFNSTEVTVEAIAVGANSTSTPLNTPHITSVYVTSTKDLSNVVLELRNPEEPHNLVEQKFDDLSSYTGNFKGVNRDDEPYNEWEIVGVWIKSGCNGSGDGSGKGEYIEAPPEEPYGFTRHGENTANGCIPHVTATFNATGEEFKNSGSPSPVRLVK